MAERRDDDLLLELGDRVKNGKIYWWEAANEYNLATGASITGETLRGRYRYLKGNIKSGWGRTNEKKASLSAVKQSERVRTLTEDKKSLIGMNKALQAELSATREKGTILDRQVDVLTSQLRKVPIDFGGMIVRFGVISDNHMGSLYEDTELLYAAYDMFEQEGITRVFNCGDLTEGIYTSKRSQHQFEVRVHGYDQQADYVVEHYPHKDGIVTELITGNHDATFYKSVGADIGKSIAANRPDINYHGYMETDFVVKCDTGEAVVRMFHPDGGTAYALSYKLQKIVESFSGGHKPNVLLLGHFHKSEYVFYMNVHCIQAGTTQHQTPFMRGKHMPAHRGFWIVEMKINQAGVSMFRPLWFPDYG